MRTKKTTGLVVILFSLSFPLLAQGTTKPFYFPHKTADIWEYFYDTGSSYPPDTFQILTIFDSTDAQGLIHMVQYSRFINPIIYPTTHKYWIDTLNHYVYGEGRDDSTLLLRLDANKNEVWIVYDYGAVYKIAKVQDKWEGAIFGKETMFMEIGYYQTNDINDSTTWLHISTNIIADGFGSVYIGGGDVFAEYNLIGAKINDTLYGNITPVSVRNNKDYLPSEIKLNQNYPNPFNPSTTITFELSKLSKVSLIIYNLLGKEIYTLLDNQELIMGKHKIVWNGITSSGNKAASGIYFYSISVNDFRQVKKMILAK